MDGLCQTIKIRGFQDVGYYGLDFTWCNMQVKDDRICLRLGKAFATFECLIILVIQEFIIWLTKH